MSEQYGHFELVKKLATGGMAQIYLARHKGIEGFERLCVVKRILPHLAENDDFIQMFLDEAKIAARLNHPNIVSIYDLGAQADSYYLAMEFIHGEDLRRIWKRAEAKGVELPIPFILRVIADAAAGLDYAHKRVDNGKALNIVHRDISPQNILVSFEGAVKVVDFGIAKAADKMTHTRSGVLKGKYSYMSPEQAEGSSSSPVDHRTDIFALGIVLYELLTGTRLFKRGNDIQTLNAVMQCEVAPPSQVNTRVPPDLDQVVMKALQKRADDRYPDARALQLSLEQWLTGHQQPSSSAYVAEFMATLYADRLAEERSQGGVNPEAVPEIRSAEEEISPRGVRPRTPTSGARAASGRSASSSRPAAKVDEPTSSLRGPKAPPARASGKVNTVSLRSAAAPAPRDVLPAESDPRSTAVSVTRAPSRSLQIGIALAALVGVAGLLVLLFRPPPAPQTFATVRVQTDPPGATLVFNGRTVPEVTPTTLPQVPAGQYALVVGKAPYDDQKLTVTVPEAGDVTLPLIRLQRPAEAAPRKVRVTLQTQPSGARIVADGAEAGTSPLELTFAAGTQVRVRAELAGHVPAERLVRVGDADAQSETLELAKVKRVEPDRTVAKDPDRTVAKEPDRTVVKEPPRGVGTVRFVVTPVGAWANVSCGSYNFGATPFPDKQLPSGVYDCTFSNPELGTRREKVEVRANDLSKVTVKF